MRVAGLVSAYLGVIVAIGALLILSAVIYGVAIVIRNRREAAYWSELAEKMRGRPR